jgi:hypothetical protein
MFLMLQGNVINNKLACMDSVKTWAKSIFYQDLMKCSLKRIKWYQV